MRTKFAKRDSIPWPGSPDEYAAHAGKPKACIAATGAFYPVNESRLICIYCLSAALKLKRQHRSCSRMSRRRAGPGHCTVKLLRADETPYPIVQYDGKPCVVAIPGAGSAPPLGCSAWVQVFKDPTSSMHSLYELTLESCAGRCVQGGGRGASNLHLSQ